MNPETQSLLEAFDRLADDEKRAFAQEVFRRAFSFKPGSPAGEQIDVTSDAFLETLGMVPRMISVNEYHALGDAGLLSEGSGNELWQGVIMEKRGFRPAWRFHREDFREAVRVGIFEPECRLVEGVVMVPAGHPHAFHPEGLKTWKQYMKDRPWEEDDLTAEP